MDWINDVCLSCDRQTADGEKFCSQACRLTDLERAGHSEPATPSSLPVSAPSWMSWQMPTTANRSTFQLAPPVNFSAYKSNNNNNNNTESPPSSPRTRTAPRHSSINSSYFTTSTPATAYSQSYASQRALTTSPSRSSLSSVSSSTTSSTVSTPGLSSEAMNQLRDYSGAFDTVRDWKRRITLG